MSTPDPNLARWRLVIGKEAEEHQIDCGGNAEAERIEKLVGFLFEDGKGGNEQRLAQLTGEIAQAGVRMVGLGALGYDARPAYCKATAKKLRKAGMDILVWTPEKFAQAWQRSSGLSQMAHRRFSHPVTWAS